MVEGGTHLEQSPKLPMQTSPVLCQTSKLSGTESSNSQSLTITDIVILARVNHSRVFDHVILPPAALVASYDCEQIRRYCEQICIGFCEIFFPEAERKVIPVALGNLERVNILLQGPLSTREGQIDMLEMVELGDGGVRVAGEGWGLRFAPAPALAWIESAALVAAYVEILHVSQYERTSQGPSQPEAIGTLLSGRASHNCHMLSSKWLEPLKI